MGVFMREEFSDSVAWVKALNDDGKTVEAIAFNRSNFKTLSSEYFPGKRSPGDINYLHCGFERLHARRIEKIPWELPPLIHSQEAVSLATTILNSGRASHMQLYTPRFFHRQRRNRRNLPFPFNC
jgi:hypothetical protein